MPRQHHQPIEVGFESRGIARLHDFRRCHDLLANPQRHLGELLGVSLHHRPELRELLAQPMREIRREVGRHRAIVVEVRLCVRRWTGYLWMSTARGVLWTSCVWLVRRDDPYFWRPK